MAVQYKQRGAEGWAEGEIRRLLRGLQRPHILESEPLAESLRLHYGLESSYAATLRLIAETFVNKGLIGKRLYDLIKKCDIDGTGTHLEIAAQMNISLRQFFRYRREAIRALALHLQASVQAVPQEDVLEELARLLSDHNPGAAANVYGLFPGSTFKAAVRLEVLLAAQLPVEDSVLEGCDPSERALSLLTIARSLLARGDRRAGLAVGQAVRESIFEAHIRDRATIEFALLATRYLDAFLYEDAHVAGLLAQDLRLAANGEPELVTRALLVEMEAAIRLGALSRAESCYRVAQALAVSRKRLSTIGKLTWRRAAIAFMRGELDQADALLKGALLALRMRPHDAMAVEALHGRVRFQMGLPWRAPSELQGPTKQPDIAITPSPGGALVASSSSAANFARLALDAVELRAMLTGDPGLDERSVRAFLVQTESAGYRAHQASGYALLANVHERHANAAGAQAAYLQAWEIYAGLADELLGHDLIIFDAAKSRDLGPLVLDDTFLDAFLARFQNGRTREFWRDAISSSYARGSSGAHPQASRQLPDEYHGLALAREAAQRLSIFVPARARAGFIETLVRTVMQSFDYDVEFLSNSA